MDIVIRPLTDADIDAGLRLGAQNGWNQRAADWRRQLDLEPAACFAAEAAGQVVGTACACVFDSVAWVNLVLVDQLWRGRGIGTRLMRRVLAHLEERNVSSIRLDATPLGQPIYEKLGFQADYALTRYAAKLRGTSQGPVGVEKAATADLAAIAQLDEGVTGTQRGRLLALMLDDDSGGLVVVRQANRLAGYAGYRRGARAWQIGPCIGAACGDLLNSLMLALGGQGFIDVPVPSREANAHAAALAWQPQRTLLRMGRGVRVHEQLDRMWCSFGPEKG
jgi:GNAT superfamily N-acetyltransferase